VTARIVVERHSRALRDKVNGTLTVLGFDLVYEEDPAFEQYYGDMYFVRRGRDRYHFPSSRLHELLPRARLRRETLSASPMSAPSAGAHPLILPVASRTRCTCFEPDPASHTALAEFYAGKSPFADLVIHDCALAEKDEMRRLHVTKSAVNTSLLEPDPAFASRYGVAGLAVTHTMDIRTRSLDGALARDRKEKGHVAELIKLDCQGGGVRHTPRRGRDPQQGNASPSSASPSSLSCTGPEDILRGGPLSQEKGFCALRARAAFRIGKKPRPQAL
jgi:FkbM family methyltransferase